MRTQTCSSTRKRTWERKKEERSCRIGQIDFGFTLYLTCTVPVPVLARLLQFIYGRLRGRCQQQSVGRAPYNSGRSQLRDSFADERLLAAARADNQDMLLEILEAGGFDINFQDGLGNTGALTVFFVLDVPLITVETLALHIA